ncbi:hypothetical protein [Alicyclobacillus macrosporangiidus]|uniref:hypothetical protein n=1 Tax=Alicyclobacillus macrosporangiidus TaxID=392015 RepID=UPI000498648C|nr:hypothetical protein [Alicyclobacillus macrosporangiidus]
MLYLAFPSDLRERYKDSVWLVYDKHVKDTQFTPEDTLVLTSWVVPQRTEQLQIIHRARQQGARVIFIGAEEEGTEEFKRQLCLMGVYDWAFFRDEVVLGEIDKLIEHPRTPADVREYVGEQDAGAPRQPPPVVEIIEPPEDKDTSGLRGRFRRASRWGKRASPSTQVQVVQPRLLVVVGLWSRSGVTTVSYLLSKLFAERLPVSGVTCIEHPRQWPRMWDYFQLDERMPPEQYRHWTEDGAGQGIEVDGVSLVPLPPGCETAGDCQQQMVQYIFRQLRKPVTVIDCGVNFKEELLFGVADRVVCVLDCDPTYLAVNELGNRYRYLTEKCGQRLVTVLNKWTSFAHYGDLFEGAVRVPYLPPERVQQALWAGKFIDVSDIKEQLKELEARVVGPLLPTQAE